MVCHPTTLVFIGAVPVSGRKGLSIIYLTQCEKTKAKEGSGIGLKFTASVLKEPELEVRPDSKQGECHVVIRLFQFRSQGL